MSASTDAAHKLAASAKADMLMPFTFWEVDGLYVVVYQGPAAEAFKRVCLPEASYMIDDDPHLKGRPS